MAAQAPPNRLALYGALTVAHGESLHAELGAALRGDGDLVIAIEPDADVDLAFLQLLAAARRSAAALGKSARLHAPPSGPLAEALRNCGFASAPGATELDRILSPNTGSRP